MKQSNDGKYWSTRKADTLQDQNTHMKGTCTCPNFTACKHVIGITILYCRYIDYDILAPASCSCDASRSAYVLSSGSGTAFLQHLFLNLPHPFDLLTEPLTQIIINHDVDNNCQQRKSQVTILLTCITNTTTKPNEHIPIVSQFNSHLDNFLLLIQLWHSS